ncbi:MAG: hypothetical protein KGS61_05835 [Verrucomicrobia bacterium]|nr:hypothetical protein [Verrucomicrobiota bacterium]
MKRSVRIALFAILLVLACVFGGSFYSRYARIMNENPTSVTTSAEEVRVPDYDKATPQNRIYAHMMMFGAAFFFSVVALGLLTAHELSQWVAAKTVKVLFNEEGEGLRDPEYERAEQVWANGDPLEAIRLLREYLRKDPRAQFAALRIAELYEKDLQNPLAAILEYEEVLKHRLPPEQWGWTAIHLCNLYNHNDKADQVVALLRRIVTEYGQTAAAAKARKRLLQIDPTFVEEPPETEPEPEPDHAVPAKVAESPPPVSHLPPGFRPKKT